MRRSPRLLLPATLEEAVDCLQRDDGEALVVAGCTAVSLMLHHRLIEPSSLVALARIPGLSDITVSDGVMTIGALVRHQEIERSSLITDTLPILADTFRVVANHRVRAAATVGGVLAEADYASDPPATLRALDAAAVVVGPTGERRVPVADLLTGFYQTSLRIGEVIRAVEIPLLAVGTVGSYRKYRSTASEDRPCVGVAALAQLDEDGNCQEARVCVGAASAIPLRLADVEQAAGGRPLDADAVEEIANAYANAIEPFEDVRGTAWYRREMVRVFVTRALLDCRSPTLTPSDRPVSA